MKIFCYSFASLFYWFLIRTLIILISTFFYFCYARICNMKPSGNFKFMTRRSYQPFWNYRFSCWIRSFNLFLFCRYRFLKVFSGISFSCTRSCLFLYRSQLCETSRSMACCTTSFPVLLPPVLLSYFISTHLSRLIGQPIILHTEIYRDIGPFL